MRPCLDRNGSSILLALPAQLLEKKAKRVSRFRLRRCDFAPGEPDEPFDQTCLATGAISNDNKRLLTFIKHYFISFRLRKDIMYTGFNNCGASTKTRRPAVMRKRADPSDKLESPNKHPSPVS